MKSIDETKPLFLDEKIQPVSDPYATKNMLTNYSGNIECIITENIQDIITNHSNSKSNEIVQVRDSNSNNTKTDDISSNICFTNDVEMSDVNVISDSCSNPQPNIVLPNHLITQNNYIASPKLLTGIKRARKSKIESPNIKKFCNRTDKRIDEMFKNQPIGQPNPVIRPHRKSVSESAADIVTDNNSMPNVSTNVTNVTNVSGDREETVAIVQPKEIPKSNPIRLDSIAIKLDIHLLQLRSKVQGLEEELEVLQQKTEANKENRLKSREMNIKTLIQLTELERRSAKARVNQNNLELGQFKQRRVGVHYEEKWYEGVKYQDIEKRKKEIAKKKEENDKNKKIWNKKRPTKPKGSLEYTITPREAKEYYYQTEIYDIQKLNIDKEEKELQAELDRFDLERNLHIREIKRINSEEASRFRDFRILHDRYLILSLLGKGGFSEVHKGFDLDELCFVACKIHELAPNWSQEKKDSYIKHALREISIHKSLDHNRIVKVHDVFNIDNDAFCTVLEYCEGNDLDFFLKQNKYIAEREAKSIICQLVSALRYLNDRKNPIIHYDLKPGNILLNNNGEIKITDFGLSKIFPDDHQNSEGMELTSQGAGTYWYLPPECFVTDNGPPTISSKVDVWSVGVIFYQCLYGRKPFGNNMTQTDILQNNTILAAKNIMFPANPKVSDAAKDFIKKCCTYHKEHRPDVFQVCGEDYLKPKAQLKNTVDTAALSSTFVIPVPL